MSSSEGVGLWEASNKLSTTRDNYGCESRTCSNHNRSHNNPQATNAHHPVRLRSLRYYFVYRINIGFAALTMNKELAITSQQFGLLSGIFFWGYFIFEIPSNLLLHKLGARIWIARILVSWGIVAILTGFVRSATHLYLLRFLLGVAEAGYFPGI